MNTEMLIDLSSKGLRKLLLFLNQHEDYHFANVYNHESRRQRRIELFITMAQKIQSKSD